MLNLHVIYDVTIAIKWGKFILISYPDLTLFYTEGDLDTRLLPCQVSLNALYSTSVCGLKNAQFWELREQKP